MHIRKIILCAAVVFGFHGPSIAQLSDITAGELALTPPYCQDVQTMNGWSKSKPSPRTAHWIELMGESFWAMHHQCWAMIRIRRAQAPGVPPIIRKGMLQHSVGDFMFVINNSTPNFVLLPEIYTQLGDNYLLLGEPGAAYDAYTRARTIKPDYWPPYARWAEALVKAKQPAEAKALVAQGLRYSPEAKPLIALYRKLGGNPQEIQPIVKKVKAPDQADDASPDAPAASAPTPAASASVQ
jgi:tetratricopeptide (TPR) repeat protein